jgi:ABC-2 type transport system ATP-binding protein
VVNGRIRALDTPSRLVSSGSDNTRLLVPAHRLTAEQAREIPGVLDAQTDGDEVVLETEDPGPVLSAVEKIAGLQGVRTRTPSLEDVYLQLTAPPSGG